MDRFGRKQTLIGSCVLVMIGALILYLATSYCTILIGVLVCGLAVGMFGPASFLLLCEICLIR